MGYVKSSAELRQLADKVVVEGLPIALDCETGYAGEERSHRNTSPSFHPEENVLAGFNFTNALAWAMYVPLGHDETRYNLDPVLAAQALWDMVSTGLCVVHNADMEERCLSRFLLRYLADDPERGEAVRASDGYFPIRSDTMMEAYVLAKWERIGLKFLSKIVFDHDQVELIELFNDVMFGVQGKKLPKNKSHMLRFTVLDPSDPRVFNYACDDVIQTLHLHQQNYPEVKDSFIYWLEMHVWPVVWRMEDAGLAVDWDFIDAARGRARDFKMKMQMGLVSHLAERGCATPLSNPGSAVLLRKILYAEPPVGLGLHTHIMTEGGKDGLNKKEATSALALKGNSSDLFVRRLQDYRGMSKLLSTYLESWRAEYGWCEDGRAHCHLLPHGTVTGRFSSADFNYQNLPKKYHYECDGAEFKFNFRDCVIAPPGYWGLGFDISQGELRIIAAEAQEQSMLDAFAEGEDLHTLTAMRLLGLTAGEVVVGGELGGKQYPAESGGFRPFGKMLNFALGYQLSAKGLADRLGCSVDEAKDHFASYFKVYPAIAAWTRDTVAESHVHGRTKSRLGRLHPIWAYESDKSWVQSGGERTAGNAPIQGGLADMMKMIMVRVDAALGDAGLKESVRMVMNIHDALEFYVRKDIPPQQVIDLLTPVIIQKTPWTQHWPVMKPEWHMWEKWGSPIELKLDDNYRILSRGAVTDIGIQEEDDDDGDVDEEVPALSGLAAASYPGLAVLAGQAGAVRAGAVFQPHSGRVIVRVTEMPEMSVLQRFMRLVAEFPGPNEMVLAVPEGDSVVSHGTSLSPDDSAQISLVFGGATVLWDTATVNCGNLVEGMKF